MDQPDDDVSELDYVRAQLDLARRERDQARAALSRLVVVVLTMREHPE